jgi:hypothetical protein
MYWMMKRVCFVVLMLLATVSYGQQLKTRNIIIVTLDGYRWQEMFGGADPEILSDTEYSDNPELILAYQGQSSTERREKLMPFFWNVISKQGQLYGNRDYHNKVNCSNHHLLSYPGYSEMLVGFPEKKISGNKKSVNPNATVLEYLHHDKAFHKRVAAFATWDVFPYILRKDQVDFHVNAGTDLATGIISEKEEAINTLQKENGRHDELTFQYAMEYLKRERPRVMFIGFDETDLHGHAGRYDDYLQAAHDADRRIGELWQWIQSQPDYKDQTTVFITTDHGRGNGKNSWRNHRLLARGSRQIWFAVLGPDTPAFGELQFAAKYYQKQVAKTIAAFLGVQYQSTQPVGEVVQTMMAVPVSLPKKMPDAYTRAHESTNK